MTKTTLLLTFFISSSTFAQSDDKKGLLPELKINSTDESINEKKQVTSELMIARAEDKALVSLQSLLKRNKGTAQEPDLLYRLAELYMRKSKTGRFFDLFQDAKTKQLSSVPIPPQKGKDWIRKASATYSDIEKRFPKFDQMDAVLFNNAFASQLLNEMKRSEVLYKKLLDLYPNSSLIPDALIALGELLYEQGRFREAKTSFENIERFPNSRVYSYGSYKLAWTLYNLKLSDEAIQKLVEVIEKNPLKLEQNRSYNLRKEALRDIVLFVGDTIKPNEVYSFFKKITSNEELGESMSSLAKLYSAYNREKEIHIFLNEFIDKEKNHPYLVKSYMTLVTANENLKKRDEVLLNLEKASKLCETNSIWKAKLEPAFATETCQSDFRKTSLEIAKKWWDIWTKNKAHTEFSKLTEKSLRLVLKGDDPEKPDFKTRFALAELLFQLKQYDEASSEYELVGKTSTDAAITHDSNYAALFSMQKSIEIKKTPEKHKKIKELSLLYIQKHPQGVHSLPVQLQVAISEYESNQDKAAEDYLKPLLSQSKSQEIKLKAQDLMLDILNFRKDFTNLKIQASQFLKESKVPTRTENLQKIFEEAHYSEVQRNLNTQSKIQVSEQLLDFRKTHPKSGLSKEALWQALSLAYADGFTLKGADLSNEFASLYPEDKRSLDAIRESANSYFAIGRIPDALSAYQKIVKTNPKDLRKLQDLIIELNLLEGKKTEARKMILDLMKNSKGEEKKQLQSQYMNSFEESEKQSPEFKKYIQSLVDLGQEPYATQFWTNLAQDQFNKKQYSQAFQTATKAMSRDSSMNDRAPARIIQARILEQEFLSQSVKVSQEDRLSIVLNIKTEKLDKALTAYNSASKMTQDPKMTVEILEGLDRCYNHYISSLNTMPLPATISEEDQKTLRSEIAKITIPIQEKLEDNKKILSQVASKTMSTGLGKISWLDLKPQDSAPIAFEGIKPINIDMFIPDSWIDTDPDPIIKSKNKCESKQNKKEISQAELAKWIGNCYYSNNQVFENEALALTDTPTNRAWGLFYLSLSSERSKLLTKSYWLIEKALKLDPKNEVFQFQKVRTLSRIEDLSSVSGELLSLYNSKNFKTPDLQALQAAHLANLGDWTPALNLLDSLPKETKEKHQLALLIAEAQNRTGDFDGAVKSIQKSTLKNTLEGSLFIAKIFESSKPELVLAQENYKKALSLTSDSSQKMWIEKKLEYLNSLKR